MEEVEICIPTLNEEDVILTTIAVVLALCDSWTQFRWKVTVVDNGSTDKTKELVQSLADPRVSLLVQSIKGKGAALSFAAQKSTSDLLGYIDADLSADPKHIFDLVHEIRKGADIAVGSRLIDQSAVHRSFWRTSTAHIFRMYAGLLVPLPIVDSQCGLKFMNKKGIAILSSCTDKGWFFDREFLAKAIKRNLVIREVPITWEEFRYPNRKSKLHVLQAGLKSLYSLWVVRNSVRKFK